MNEEKRRKIKRDRDRRNKELAQSVKNGEYIPAGINLQESWFPNRGKIKKDKEAVRKLYGESDGKATKTHD